MYPDDAPAVGWNHDCVCLVGIREIQCMVVSLIVVDTSPDLIRELHNSIAISAAKHLQQLLYVRGNSSISHLRISVLQWCVICSLHE